MNSLTGYLNNPQSKGNALRMYNLLSSFMVVERWASLNALIMLFNNKHITTSRRFLDKMVEFDILYKNKLNTDAHVKPFIVYRLTNLGFSLMSDKELVSLNKSIRMSEIAVTTLIHSIDLQCLHAKCIHLGYINWAKPDYSLKKKNHHLSDSTAELNGNKYAFELERYLKYHVRYQSIFNHYAKLIYNKEINLVYYVTPTIDIANKVKNYFESIKIVEFDNQKFSTNEKLFKCFKYVDYSFFGIEY